jgi:hypothetical protein
MLKTTIPHIDLRSKTPVDLLRSYPDVAHAILKSARRTYGVLSDTISGLALPFADRKSHAWLKRTCNPYLYEIESFAEILGAPGVYALNLAYEWGCTSGAYPTDETITLLRTLDWPFPELGKHVMVVRQKGKAGEFYNITWPAASGVFTGMAPGRFSAAINQAPMRRHGLSYAGDWFKNRLLSQKELGLPPAHLLRQVFEQAESYETARELLSKTPIAMPAIFILAGTHSTQGCVIERLENEAGTIELGASPQVTASNHFNSQLMYTGKGWRPREVDSHGRWRQSCSIHGHDVVHDHFDWLQSPMINPLTRLATICDASTGRLMVQGYEGMAAVTELFILPGEIQQKWKVM